MNSTQELLSLTEGKGACVFVKPNIVYIGNPKTASTSIHALFGPYNTIFSELCSLVDISTLKIISVIRNPLQRFISGYLEIQFYLDQVKDYKHAPFYAPILAESNAVNRLSCFISLCEQQLLDQHIKTQQYYLSDFNGKLLPFYKLLIFEDLEYEFSQFCIEVGHDHQLPHKNAKSSRAKNDVNQILQHHPELRTRINRLLESDWELYGQALISKLKTGDNLSFERIAMPDKRLLNFFQKS
jgi:hypothetical protein